VSVVLVGFGSVTAVGAAAEVAWTVLAGILVAAAAELASTSAVGCTAAVVAADSGAGAAPHAASTAERVRASNAVRVVCIRTTFISNLGKLIGINVASARDVGLTGISSPHPHILIFIL
jgi:hypothetical protein